MRFLSLLVLTAPALAEPSIPLRVAPAAVPSDRFCGFYCVYQAGLLTGRNLPLEQLFRAERMTGKYGASVSDLEKVCAEFGVPVVTLPRVDYADLILLSKPAISLIRSSPDAPEPNHWVLVLTARPGWATVYEPSLGTREMPEAELLALWGGPALIVTEDADFTRARWSVSKIVFATLGFGVVVFMLRIWLKWIGMPWLGLIVVTMILAALFHIVNPAGFAHNSETLSLLARARTANEPTYIEPGDLIGRENDFVIIDVRDKNQFDFERLPGAINLSITSPYWRNRDTLATQPPDKKLVLYCNSAECPWAKRMAASSLFHRHANVLVLLDGRDGYVRAGGKIERGAPR